ncbi:hypothetical protein N0O92_20265 [Alkalihalobacillus sp. MEB130]|uniref:hypothetical protein n=1 Tax=Alkalihalobacillus sp. MEB130 TaxID=2976704 RepID=UPI0028DE022B|nr:hypothetical protein [Alkalihalobacillus sp. MEB130]MDT8862543.1 hypothetical protein [Alkalihalobacillus sp. MEB130]
MIAFFVSMPIIAYLSMIAFQTMKLGAYNFENKFVPYSLGIVIIYSYGYFYALSTGLQSFSLLSFLFITSIWILGLIDDIWGKPYPKGLRGHVGYALHKKTITTGLVKAVGTIIFSVLFVTGAFPFSLLVAFIAFSLCVGLPHVMNLFDTRPLRVWKVTFSFVLVTLLVNPLPSFRFILMLLAAFYIWYVLEGYKKAMLGDNGATLVGAIMAVFSVYHLPLGMQVVLLCLSALFVLIAERYSFSKIVDSSKFLRMIDQIGIMKKQQGG